VRCIEVDPLDNDARSRAALVIDLTLRTHEAPPLYSRPVAGRRSQVIPHGAAPGWPANVIP
jgi:hypothetical protein